jgi:cytochrome c oxidase cbb3-type subunit I/II
MPTNEDLKRTVRDGVTGTAMGMFTNLRQEELEAVIEYIKGFSRKWKDEANFAPPVKFPQTPPWFADPVSRAEREGAGAKLFKIHCAACHGINGLGDGPAAAALKDYLGNVAQPADLSSAHYRNGDDPQDVFRVLTLGVSGTPMISWQKELTVEERWELAAFVRKLAASGSK